MLPTSSNAFKLVGELLMGFDFELISVDIFNILIGIWNYCYKLLNSDVFIAAVLATLVAPWLAIKSFMTQRRISILQKIYYEESLLNQLNHLDDAMNISNETFAHFETACNLLNLGSTISIFSTNSSRGYTVDSLKAIVNLIETPVMYQPSKIEVVVVLFKQYGYVFYEWLFRFDNDCRIFNLHIKEVITGWIINLHTGKPFYELQSEMRKELKEINSLYHQLLRHKTPLYLFNALVSRIGLLNFKSKKALINNVAKDAEINVSLKKFDEVYKILFGYYKINENTLISYMTVEKGHRFKLTFNENITIEPVNHDDQLKENQMKIVSDDTPIRSCRVELNGITYNYSELQLRMANLSAFHEKPKMYVTVKSFINMLKS
jgi:hypothetical protein